MRLIDADLAEELIIEHSIQIYAGGKQVLSGAFSVEASACLDKCPTINAEPVRHGRWVGPVQGDGDDYCSVCKKPAAWIYDYGYFEPDICYNCGAKMDR